MTICFRAWGGREHTEIRTLGPGRSTSSCPSHFFLFYSMNNSRRKISCIIPPIIYNFRAPSFTLSSSLLQVHILTIPGSRKERLYHTSFSHFPPDRKSLFPSVMHPAPCALGSVRQSGSAPDSHKGTCYPCLRSRVPFIS